MSIVYNAALALLGAAFVLTAARLVRGPSTFDRIMALDVLAVLLVSGIAVHTAVHDEPANATILVVIALMGFVGSVSAARLAAARAEHREREARP
ncbi:multisubunit sodium/proton antiporter, MrpF subunit [Actinomadura meyerae]|uniref:Multisubunit sodium/proton antiporter, MrpF subunit n=1 Tax=Actinomadura meyerae TaxID=240840 RepID=A0A239C0Z6_9ACTN|nr:monovalent cation/H+ antiporter complex subunit F [Actinomadura meyerae]SNS13836.1 multisubunit sodium/proton antiporter, MrpF subunit [Actinomadura meyerae]